MYLCMQYAHTKMRVHIICSHDTCPVVLSFHWCKLDGADTTQHFHTALNDITKARNPLKSLSVSLQESKEKQKDVIPDSCQTHFDAGLWQTTDNSVHHVLSFCDLEKMKSTAWYQCVCVCNCMRVERCTLDDRGSPSCGSPRQWSRGKHKAWKQLVSAHAHASGHSLAATETFPKRQLTKKKKETDFLV